MTRALPAVGPPRALRRVAIERATLTNGVAVAVVERHELPIVDIMVVLRTGAVIDTLETAGRASLAAEMIDEGTASRTAFEIAEQLDHLGGYLSVQPGWDSTTLSVRVLTRHFDAALAIMADVLRNATFPPEEFRRKQAERLTALLQDRDEAAALAGKALAAAVFGTHPYGTPPEGTQESVQRLTRDDVAAVYEKHYGGGHAFVLLVGDVDAAAATRTLEAELGSWGNAARGLSPAVPAPVLDTQRRLLLVDKPGAAQAELRVGHSAPPRTTADYFPLVVLNTILGGSFTSRLNLILRERMGVTYGVSSRFRLRRDGGLFTTGAAILSEAVARSAQVVIEEMERLRADLVSPDELQRAQSYKALGLPRSFESTEDIAARVREQLLYGFDDDYWQSYVERVMAVSAEDVRSAAARHLHPEASTIVVTADARSVQDALAHIGLGEVVLTDVAT